MNNENTVCHLRWGYPNISLSRNEIRTCCKTPFQKISDELLDYHQTDIFLNTHYQKKRRMEMLQGVQHSDCKSCWSLEKTGAKSLRGVPRRPRALVRASDDNGDHPFDVGAAQPARLRFAWMAAL